MLNKLTFKVKDNFLFIAILWFLVCLVSWQFNFSHDKLNNYRIFVGVYDHLLAQINLYLEYPQEYGDTNHYGPLFSLIIAPFTYLSIGFGSLMWNFFNGALLMYAIWLLPLSKHKRWLLLLLSSLEFANTTHSSQSNCIITALIIFSFVLVEKKKDHWATCLIVLGAMVKIYPVMALVFFIFSKRKPVFIISAVAWAAFFFVLPMLFSSSDFIIQSYQDWFYSLVAKNGSNREIGASINYSIIGVIDGLTATNTTSVGLVVGFGLLIFGFPLLRRPFLDSQQFKLNYLSSVLLFVVLFSTSSEHPTYIIAVVGAFLWMVQQPGLFTKKYQWLIISLLVLTGLGPTDAMPEVIRTNFIDLFAVKAWPCIIVWLLVSYQLLNEKFHVNEMVDETIMEQQERWSNRSGYNM